MGARLRIARVYSQSKILDITGEGVMDVACQARETSSDRTVALKFFSNYLTSSETGRAGLLQEACIASLPDRPNIRKACNIWDGAKQKFHLGESIGGVTIPGRIPIYSFSHTVVSLEPDTFFPDVALTESLSGHLPFRHECEERARLTALCKEPGSEMEDESGLARVAYVGSGSRGTWSPQSPTSFLTVIFRDNQ